MECLLLDVSVIVTSDHTWLLTDTCETLMSMMYPFKIKYSLPEYFPLVPADADVETRLDSPFNFCLGVRKDHLVRSVRAVVFENFKSHSFPSNTTQVRQGILEFERDDYNEENNERSSSNDEDHTSTSSNGQFRQVQMTTQNNELKNLLSRRVCFVDLDVAYSSMPSKACKEQLQWGMRAIVKRMNGVARMTSVIPSNLRRRVLNAFGSDSFSEKPIPRSLSSSISADLEDESMLLEDDMEDGEGT